MAGQNDKRHSLEETEIRRAVNARRVVVFNDRVVAAAYSSPFGTLLLAWIVSQAAGWPVALTWLGLINACELLLICIGRHFSQKDKTAQLVVAWAKWLVIAQFLLGLAWGSSVWFFWVDGKFLIYVLNLTVLVAVSGICVVVMSPSRRGMTLFTGGILLLPVLHLCFVSHDYELEVALGLLVLFVLELQYGRVAGRQLLQGLQAEVRAEQLAVELAQRTVALEQSHTELNQAQAVSSVGSWIYERRSDTIRLSPEACRLFSEPLGAVITGPAYVNRVHDADRLAMRKAWRQAKSTGEFDHEHRIQTGKGYRWLRQRAKLDISPDGQLVRAVGTSQDVTEKKQAEIALRESESRYRTMIEWSTECIGVHRNGLVLYVNTAATKALGAASADSLLGRSIMDFVHPDFREIAIRRAILPLPPGDSHPVLEEKFLTVNGEAMDVEVQSIGIVFDGEPAIQVAFRDITERKAAAEMIEHLAFYDPLTELPNRRLMLDRLGQALTISERRKSCGAVMMIDLDNFKGLNDTLGHAVGDQLLMGVAKRLKRRLRQGDTVARLGGDEFVVVLNDLGDESIAATHAEEIASTILHDLGQPFTLTLYQNANDDSRRSHHCSASIGITVFQGHAVPMDELMKRSDTAMYHAKGSGRSTLRFYDPALQGAVEMRAALEADLRRAIEEQQFVLYYQAQINSQREVVGAEALIRWHHPTRGLIYPSDFIPMAEETGLIVQIGHWVLQTACRQLSKWSQDAALRHLTIAVNVSAGQFSQPDLQAQIQSVLQSSGSPAARLKLELTESMLVRDTDEAIISMRKLKTLGIKISLDDFGMGYSSLSYLKHLPIDQLKIDRSFVKDIQGNAYDSAIARTMLTLGQSMGLEIIAEGVETQEQLEVLASLGCRMYQGYLFAHPTEVNELENLVRAKDFADPHALTIST